MPKERGERGGIGEGRRRGDETDGDSKAGDGAIEEKRKRRRNRKKATECIARKQRGERRRELKKKGRGG